MKKGYIISLIVIVALAVLIFYKLKSNKEDIDRLTSLAEEKISVYPVRVVEATKGNKVATSFLSGRLIAAEEIMLTSALAGRVEEIHVKNGDKVTQGQLLISLEDKIIRSEVGITKAAYEKAKSDLEKFTKLAASDAVTSQQLELLKLNEQSSKAKYEGALQKLNETRITAPISGTVHQVMTKVGSLCGPTTPICELVDTRSLKLKLSVGENIASKVITGDSVRIDVPVVNIKGLPGRVTYVGVKPGYTGMFPLEIVLQNNGQLKAGYRAEITINRTLNDVTAVPKSAVQGSVDEKYVFVAAGMNAKKKKVVTGTTLNNEIVITRGITPGDLIVTEGANRLEDGSSIKIVSN